MTAARDIHAAAADDAAGQSPRARLRSLAGAVLAWSRMHGTVSLEVMGRFAGMGHDPGTLFEADIGTLADAFGLK
ncbi:TetR-like C-terminal domain-containing protein [Streptosporangium lutulentum]|uniref:HTH-type transcriptional regulator MT1864/Rv1816-like C-terminal domain-containing protein n=1 Tax=Streptosporangium lutulentum TaxID=1461250 RepID=A0ABT9QNE5_9ACTN|nr:TetR-like C-terminal domain-containing protein [Streptosporangium lutulentum]MDP9848276.1 hypothetical protein [Streptosporangium lutulentum]